MVSSCRPSDKVCKAYLDDVIMYSNTLEEYEEYLERVLESFRVHGLWCNLPKCSFMRDEHDYLGHDIPKRKSNVNKKYCMNSRVSDPKDR